MNDIVGRRFDQINGCIMPNNTLNPACSVRPRGTWDGHNQTIRQKQNHLSKLERDWDNNNCDDDDNSSGGARTVAQTVQEFNGQDQTVTEGEYLGPDGEGVPWQLPTVLPLIIAPLPNNSIRRPRTGGGGFMTVLPPQLLLM